MKEPQSPCMGCKKRYIGCHDKCDIFLAYKTEYAKWCELIAKAKDEETALDMVERKRFEKYRKMKKRGEMW